MSALVFGSKEAQAIVERDRELRQREEQEADELPKGDAAELSERLESLEFQIEEMRSELRSLQIEASRIRLRIKQLGPAKGNAGWSDVNKWNAWAKGVAQQ